MLGMVSPAANIVGVFSLFVYRYPTHFLVYLGRSNGFNHSTERFSVLNRVAAAVMAESEVSSRLIMRFEI